METMGNMEQKAPLFRLPRLGSVGAYPGQSDPRLGHGFLLPRAWPRALWGRGRADLDPRLHSVPLCPPSPIFSGRFSIYIEELHPCGKVQTSRTLPVCSWRSAPGLQGDWVLLPCLPPLSSSQVAHGEPMPVLSSVNLCDCIPLSRLAVGFHPSRLPSTWVTVFLGWLATRSPHFTLPEYSF